MTKNIEKILFVDDDEKIIESFKKQLGDKYNINFVTDPLIALDHIKNNKKYSVVIADLKMPGIDGIRFLERFKKLSPLTTRIMLTGNAELDVAIDAINKGFIFKFLTKPCLKQDLLNTINQAVKNYKDAIKQQTESLTDPLTNLWNRRYLNKEIERIFKSAERYKYDFSILFIDINYFKKINDQFGHNKGDSILKTVATVLKDTCRKTDIIVRYGGDEFIVLMEHNDKTKIIHLANRIKKNLSEKYIDKKHTMNISIATGIASYPKDAGDIKSLLAIADREMYKDKKNEKI